MPNSNTLNFFYTNYTISFTPENIPVLLGKRCFQHAAVGAGTNIRQIMIKVLNMFMTFRVGFSFTFRHLKPLLYGCLFAILISRLPF